MTARNLLQETAAGEHGRGARVRGRQVGGRGAKARAAAGRNAAGSEATNVEASKNAQAAERVFDSACAAVGKAERDGAKGAFARLVQVCIPWLPYGPTTEAVAITMDRHGLIAHRAKRRKGATTAVDGALDTAPARMVLTLARLSTGEPWKYLTPKARVRMEAIIKSGGVVMHDGQKYSTPLDALLSGRYAKSSVATAWGDAMRPPRDVSGIAGTLEGALEAKGEMVRIPVQVKGRGGKVATVNANDSKAGALMVACALLSKWGSVEGFTPEEQATVVKALETKPTTIAPPAVEGDAPPAESDKSQAA